MRLSKRVLAFVCLAWVAAAGPVFAQTAPPTEGGAKRAFRYGLDGLGLGAYLGIATGYLVARSDDWTRSDWRILGLGAGIGALAGAGVGVTLGVVDAARTDEPIGKLVLSNMGSGATFGTVLGAVGGGVSWLSGNEAEHILYGAGIGTLAGAGVGLVFAIIEANRRPSMAAAERPSVVLTLGAASHAQGTMCLFPSLVGRY
jgi:hypothetical protein